MLEINDEFTLIAEENVHRREEEYREAHRDTEQYYRELVLLVKSAVRLVFSVFSGSFFLLCRFSGGSSLLDGCFFSIFHYYPLFSQKSLHITF